MTRPPLVRGTPGGELPALNANIASDRELAARLLAQFDLAIGDLVYVEEKNRTERRGWIGQILFGWVDSKGNVRATVTGRSGWAPGSCAVTILGTDPHAGCYFRRRLDADDRVLLGARSHYGFTNTPLNWREAR